MSHRPNTHPSKEVEILILVCNSGNLLSTESIKIGERVRPGSPTLLKGDQ